MKKYKEEILKYLSGMMNETDQTSFEEKLKSSRELDEQYNSIKRMLNDFKKQDINVDENYFINILPRFREKVDSRKNKLRKTIFYLAPALTIIIMAVLLYPSNNPSFDNYYIELAEIVVENIEDAEVSNNYLNNISLESGYSTLAVNDEFTVGLENSITNIPDSYLNIFEYSNSEAFYSLENYSDEELNNLYENLNDFKFQ